MNRVIHIILLLLITLSAAAQYQQDELGQGFMNLPIEMPNDYEGKVICTLIKRESPTKSQKALLYVHGFNDYFFQTEMADRFNEKGYNFYAIDLRKYGRSLLPNQTRCNARSINEYFADIDSALNIIKSEGNDTIVLMGHSTGGLTTSLYCHTKGSNCPVDALILNSPFFKFNLSTLLNNVVVPVVSFIAPLFPNITIPQGESTAYAESLLKQYKGEWEFDTNKKLMLSPDVTSGWIDAIYTAQKEVWQGLDIKIPILALYSTSSINADKWEPAYMQADAVLNVADIAKYTRTLGHNVKRVAISGGMHDILCSQPSVRNTAYTQIFQWLGDSKY